MNPVFPLRLVLIAACLGGAAGARAADGEVVVMSPYEVSANSVDFSRWIKVASPHYILYTDASLPEAADVLRELELVRAAAAIFLRREARIVPPAVVVLPTSDSDWRRIASKGVVNWQVSIAQPAELMANLTLAEYDWQQEGLATLHAIQAGPILDALGLEGPFVQTVWFSQGLAGFLEAAHVSRDAVTFGRPSLRAAVLARTGWLSWPRFFAATPQSSEFRRDALSHQQLTAQSAAFLHYVLANPDPGWDERLMKWLMPAETQGDAMEARFKEAFGHDWKTWQQTMERHVRDGPYRVTTVEVPAAQRQFAAARLELSTREMRELFVLSQILNQQTRESKASLDALLARGLKTEALRRLLVEACLKNGRLEVASAEAEKIVAQRTADPTALATAALLRFLQEVKETSIRARLTPATANVVRAWCQRAIAIEPREAVANTILAWTEALAPEVTPAGVAAIESIHRRLSAEGVATDVACALAVACWRVGEIDKARRLAQWLAGLPYTEKPTRKVVDALLRETASR